MCVFVSLARGSPVVTVDGPHADEEPRAADSPASGKDPDKHASINLRFGHTCELMILCLCPSGEMELLCLGSGSPVDLLCAPVPSCLPSPQLRPDPVQLQPGDLIHFEPHPHGPSEREPVHDRQPRPVNSHLTASASETGATEPAEPSKACIMDSPGRRTARNKVKLAANFSFTSTLSV